MMLQINVLMKCIKTHMTTPYVFPIGYVVFYVNHVKMDVYMLQRPHIAYNSHVMVLAEGHEMTDITHNKRLMITVDEDMCHWILP